jgi:hypothetical protein
MQAPTPRAAARRRRPAATGPGGAQPRAGVPPHAGGTRIPQSRGQRQGWGWGWVWAVRAHEALRAALVGHRRGSSSTPWLEWSGAPASPPAAWPARSRVCARERVATPAPAASPRRPPAAPSRLPVTAGLVLAGTRPGPWDTRVQGMGMMGLPGAPPGGRAQAEQRQGGQPRLTRRRDSRVAGRDSEQSQPGRIAAAGCVGGTGNRARRQAWWFGSRCGSGGGHESML